MVKGFSRTQILLHWAVALLILFNLIFSDAMSELWDQIEHTGPMPTTTGAWVHIAVGVAVLALVAWRLALRVTRGAPHAPTGTHPLLKFAGDAGHIALYALMIALPVSGLLAFFGGFDSLAELHGGVFKALLWALIALHVLAALYHHFFLKDGLLNRMRKPG
ncbi:MAG: cytochrome b/b6 domain-containing protein [Pseudomonadota bacterium]